MPENRWVKNIKKITVSLEFILNINIKDWHILSHSEDRWKTISVAHKTFFSNSSMPILTLAKTLKNNKARGQTGTEKRAKKVQPDKQILRTIIICQIRVLKSLFICISISVRKYDNVSVRGKHLDVLHILTQTTIYSQKRRFLLCTETLLHGP